MNILEMEMEEAEDDYDDDKYEDGTASQLEECVDEHELDEDMNAMTNAMSPVGARPRRISQLPVNHQKSQKPIPKASSLFILSHTNPFRVFCNKIVNHTYFTNSVLVTYFNIFKQNLS